MHNNEMNNLDDEDDLSDSDLTCGSFDEEEDSEDDLEFEHDLESGANNASNKQNGRRKFSSYLFGQSPKLIKKFTTLKQQQKVKRTGRNTVSSKGDTTDTASKKTADSSSVWISMGNKMLDDEDNLVDQPPIDKSVINDDVEKPKTLAIDNEEAKDGVSDQTSIKSVETTKRPNETSSIESNTSLNSSQSSFVQLKTTTATSTNDDQLKAAKETKPTSPKTTSLASKWLFGRKSDQPDKTTDKKKLSVPKADKPQITQVIYKRKPNLPEIPNEPARKEKAKQTTVSIPDEEETDEDNIYAEINETQLVLEEMRRSLNQHTTERKIIEMILQQPATNLQDSKLNSVQPIN